MQLYPKDLVRFNSTFGNMMKTHMTNMTKRTRDDKKKKKEKKEGDVPSSSAAPPPVTSTPSVVRPKA